MDVVIIVEGGEEREKFQVAELVRGLVVRWGGFDFRLILAGPMGGDKNIPLK